VAFDERVKIHGLVMEGIEAALRRRGYPSVESLKGWKKAVKPKRQRIRHVARGTLMKGWLAICSLRKK